MAIGKSELTNPNQHHHRRPAAGRGRAQDTSRDDLIIEATLDLLVEGGFHALTMSDVASRAGVSKATLYRRWTAKTDLVADAFASLGHTGAPSYAGVSLKDDLLALLVQASASSKRHQVAIAGMEAARSSPELGLILRNRFVSYVREQLEILARNHPAAVGAPLAGERLDYLTDTAVSLLIYYSGANPALISQDRLVGIVDHVVLPLMAAR